MPKRAYTKYMKTLNYQTAAREAIKAFDAYRKSICVKEIEKGAQFRKLTVYESSGTADNLGHVLFGLEFCGPEGDNYREVLVSVNLVKLESSNTYEILSDVRLYTIEKC